MSVLIGHASIDENGKAKGGKAGDQTGKEVCTRSWYSKSWTVLLRPKSTALAENSARICEQICNANYVGYDQNQRNTLWNNYLKTHKVIPTTMVETDCSAFMTYCAILGGANITYGSNAPTTSTMKSKFKDSGNYEVITDRKYLESDELLKRGDILVAEGHHTVMVLTNGSNHSGEKVNSSIPADGTFNAKLIGNYKTTSIVKIFDKAVNGSAIGTLIKGAKVTCNGYYNGEWAWVTNGNLTGYVNGNYVTKA